MVDWSRREEVGIIAKTPFVGGRGYEYTAKGVVFWSSPQDFWGGEQELFDWRITCVSGRRKGIEECVSESRENETIAL